MYEFAFVNAVELRAETCFQEQAVIGRIVEIKSLLEICAARNISQHT